MYFVLGRAHLVGTPVDTPMPQDKPANYISILDAYREELGLNWSQVFRRAKIRSTADAAMKWTTGETKGPPFPEIARIALALGAPAGELFDAVRDESEEPPIPFLISSQLGELRALHADLTEYYQKLNRRLGDVEASVEQLDEVRLRKAIVEDLRAQEQGLGQNRQAPEDEHGTAG